MCGKYEHDYLKGCWDYLFFDFLADDPLYEGPSLQVFLRERLGVEVINADQFKAAMEAALDALHEQGAIRPFVEKGGT